MSAPKKQFLKADLNPFGACAFAIGTSIGWGSLVVTANTYLAQAGPMGSVFGLIAGGLIMLLIARNYSYMMQIHPDAGGAYTYVREAFGYDFAFICAWFLSLTYLAILWANATSVPLFVRYFIGDVLETGKLYSIFGYDIYMGEVLITILAIVLFGFFCMGHKRIAVRTMTVLVCVFVAGISLVFIGALIRMGGQGLSFAPGYVPDIDSSAVSQIIRIAVISPWAFIGFECISHGAEEFSFHSRKIFRIFVAALVITTLLYIFVILLSVTAYPARYENWLAYIRDRGNLTGIEALPAFYAASHYMGRLGVGLLMASLLALVMTSLIGNTMALSRLFYALGKDQVLPESFAGLNRFGQPGRAIGLIILLSVVVPFVGRTAIGWIVDITTICATLIYGLVSASTMKTAAEREDKAERITGAAGVLIMIAFGLYILLPNLVTTGSLERETYFLFIVWSMLGFLFFRSILRRDQEERFGTSTIVWVALLSLVLFIALVWMKQSMIASNEQMKANIEEYYERTRNDDLLRIDDEVYIEKQMDQMGEADTRTLLMAVGMFGFALIIMLTNHSYMSRRAKAHEAIANVDPLTGVKSKHAYLVKEKQINEAISEGRGDLFSVVVCDVNGLKQINDTYGHKAGDEHIIKASRMVCEIFAHSPVYRLGGDEFVSILTGRDYSARSELMKTLHDRSVAHISSGLVVVSGGISDFVPGEDVDFHTVFERADTRMYEEKQLLKGLGSITRDENPEEETAQPEILNVRRTVMIVEDETINQMLLEKVLQDDYDLLFAADGVEAMELAESNKDNLDLVLLDLLMPRMGGKEVLKAMKEDHNLKDIPVIILTADQNAEVECLSLGATDFISKPYPAPEIVRARVNKCVELSVNRDTIQSTERDHLTRLYNIDYFVRYVTMYDRHYQDMSMDAVVVDVNRFHLINERYGKSVGDEILKQIGHGIRQIAREIGGVGCRRGADTFLLYCPHREDYQELLKRLSDEVAGEKRFAGRVRLRMGIYSQVDKDIDIEKRYDYAKMATDTVKSGQINAVCFYTPQMREDALFKERLLGDFRSSIENNRFKVYYQPKFDIRPEKPILSSAEALVRWDHPELGMISPAVFIPLLEENGLILELDTFVWRETAARIRAWKDKYGYSVPVSVNVSRVDMLTPNLKHIFKDILKANNLTTEDIILEITESAYTGDSEQVISTARELRGMEMGFRIEMDDFGTGYSSLGMLTQLPIDALKLDMTFVRNAFGEQRDVRMIELIIDIADYLGVPVVAEGVETEEQLLVLKTLGCDLVQGYYFSKPVPDEAFESFLVERGRQSLEITQEVKKTCMNMSGALNRNFESIYYIDTLTDYYIEFYSVPGRDLQIRPGSEDFFAGAAGKLLEGLVEEDEEAMRKIMDKDGLVAWSLSENRPDISFRKKIDGTIVNYTIESIQTRSNDEHHIVIGIRRKNDD